MPDQTPTRTLLPNVYDLVNENGNKALCNPGLALDKFACPGKQEAAKDEILAVIKATESAKETYGVKDGVFEQAIKQRDAMLTALGARRFAATTTSPLSLHLARASALENAGICLHPTYGFAYIPGSGLKGMAAAFAFETWLMSKPSGERANAWELFLKIFGWAPSHRLNELADKAGVVPPKQQSSGSVVFHDAWPVRWPDLICDIVNVHHKKYYTSKIDEQVPPPGDWETPSLVYFLAVDHGQRFEFALSSSRPLAGIDDMISLTHTWLVGALVHHGAGAKTNSGYGAFHYDGHIHDNKIEPDTKTLETADSFWGDRLANGQSTRRVKSYALELTSPAFLAGARQDKEDCDLRPSTLRGQLRWWWRTLHSAWMPPDELRKLEGIIWGDSRIGGAIQINVCPKIKKTPLRFSEIVGNGKRFRMNCGLYFTTYGMADKDKDRFHLEPGASWEVNITYRQPHFLKRINEKDVIYPVCDADDALNAVESALWLLGQFGGIGAKTRKGYGSVIISPLTLNFDQCKSHAITLRKKVLAEVNLKGVFEDICASPKRSVSPSIDFIIDPINGRKTYPDYWAALDAIGKDLKNYIGNCSKDERWGIGLPRKTYDDSEKYSSLHNLRLASPIHFSVHGAPNDRFGIGIIAFNCGVGPENSKAIGAGVANHDNLLRGFLKPPAEKRESHDNPNKSS